MSMSRDTLEHLLRSDPRVWRGCGSEKQAWPVISTGFAELDAVLPGGGWPMGALVEISVRCLGLGEMRLLLPAMASLSQAGRCIAWVAPPHQAYAPALLQAGIELRQVWVVEAHQADDIPWSLEKLLRSGCCGMALAWPRRLADHQTCRLQLAAEEGSALAVLFPRQTGGASYAAIRIEARPVAEGLALDIVKARGRLRRTSLIVPG